LEGTRLGSKVDKAWRRFSSIRRELEDAMGLVTTNSFKRVCEMFSAFLEWRVASGRSRFAAKRELNEAGLG
jgi:hypothetical protein